MHRTVSCPYPITEFRTALLHFALRFQPLNITCWLPLSPFTLFSMILTFSPNFWPKYEPGQLCRYSNFLQAGGSWDKIPVRGEIFRISYRPLYDKVKVKVNQSRYTPWVVQRFPGSQGSQITWQRHRMVVRLSALRTGRLYPQKMLLVFIFVRGWVRSEWFHINEKSTDTSWDQTSDLPIGSTVP